MNKVLIRGMLVISLMVLSCSNVSAAKTKYIGGGLGNATWDLEPLGNELEDAMVFRGFMGMREDNFGWEGELSFSTHDWKNTSGEASHTAAHIVLSGVGFLPLFESMELFGKIGLNFWGTSVDYQGDIYEGDNGIDLALGFGISFNLTDKVMLRFEHQSLPGLGDGIDEGDVEQNSVNIAVNF